MIIVLPVRQFGKEIIETFKKVGEAMTTQSESAWVVEENIGELQYEAYPVQQTVRSMGAAVSATKFEKKYNFFGEKVLGKTYPKFRLKAVLLDREYSEVEMEIAYGYGSGRGGFELITDDPRDKSFQKIQPLFEEFLEKFFDNLTQVK